MLAALISLAAVARIAYVNTHYIKTRETALSIGENFEYKGLNYKILSVERYTYEDYCEKYGTTASKTISKGVACVLNFDVSNKSNEDIVADYGGINIQIGAVSSAFDMVEANRINKDFSWKCKAGEEKSVKMPYIISCSKLDQKRYNKVLKNDMEVTISDYELLRRIVVSETDL